MQRLRDYDTATMNLLFRAYDNALLQLEGSEALAPENFAATSDQLVKALIEAAKNGERELDRLKQAALKALDP
jgi:hypothetical protein